MRPSLMFKKSVCIGFGEGDKVALREAIGRADQQMEIWDLSREVQVNKVEMHLTWLHVTHTPVCRLHSLLVLCVQL